MSPAAKAFGRAVAGAFCVKGLLVCLACAWPVQVLAQDAERDAESTAQPESAPQPESARPVQANRKQLPADGKDASPERVKPEGARSEGASPNSDSADAVKRNTPKTNAKDAQAKPSDAEGSAPPGPLPPELKIPRVLLPKSQSASPRRPQAPKQPSTPGAPGAERPAPSSPDAEPPPSLEKQPDLGLDGPGLPLGPTFWQAPPPLAPAPQDAGPEGAEKPVEPTAPAAPLAPSPTSSAPQSSSPAQQDRGADRPAGAADASEQPSDARGTEDTAAGPGQAGPQDDDKADQASDTSVLDSDAALDDPDSVASETDTLEGEEGAAGEQDAVEEAPRTVVPPVVGPEPSGSFGSEVRAFVEALTSVNRARPEADTETQRRPQPAPDTAQERRSGPGFQSPLPVPACVSQDGEGQGSLLSLLLTILLVWFALSLVRRFKRGLAARGLLPFALAAVGGLLRVGLALLLVLWIGRLFPASIGPLLPWLTVAMAIGVGWSLRDPAADVFAWAVFVVERRIRPGVWISGQDFAGTVEALRLRSTYIRAQDGQRYSIENRKLLRGPLLCDTLGAAERELTVRVTARAPSNLVRRALHDAVLLSPYIHTGSAPVITQDPVKPSYWHIRARLLDPTYGEHFSGEILERVEETLAALGRPSLLNQGSIAPPSFHDLPRRP